MEQKALLQKIPCFTCCEIIKNSSTEKVIIKINSKGGSLETLSNWTETGYAKKYKNLSRID